VFSLSVSPFWACPVALEYIYLHIAVQCSARHLCLAARCWEPCNMDLSQAKAPLASLGGELHSQREPNSYPLGTQM